MAEASAIVAEKALQAFGEVIAKGALGRIAKDRHCTVVGTNDDEALGLHREDIKRSISIIGIGCVSQIRCSRPNLRVRIHKLDAQRLGAIDVNRIGLQAAEN